MSRLSLQTVVDRLEQVAPGDITVPRIAELLADGELDEATLRPFIGALPHKYARRCVHRSRYFDVMVLTWAPGQYTPVHNHAGNCGWVRLVRGQIAEQTFRLVPGAAVPDAAIAGSVHGRTGCVGLEATGAGVIDAIGAVATADRVRAIHRLGNPAAAGGDVTVTLHVYSLPHDRCLMFDVDARTCEPRHLAFDPPPV
ncbi:MAG: cysteine dioxygenase family protein [Planctomycetes bacterium]|nr:cysteine dioxygenase family protein [Planctomycetota bacterium]